ncbi:hypothetical protein HC891_28535 [Candidatus Gracilibacteria bacterium]|nr:hypothetical protein [Candidatus Gracilibacteria bacterium]
MQVPRGKGGTGRVAEWGGPTIFLVLGTLFMLIGGLVSFFIAQSGQANAERAEGLLPISGPAFNDGTPGREVLIEGVVSARNRARFRDFVAYYREEYRGTDEDGDDQYELMETVAPALLVDLNGTLVQIARDSYRFDLPHARWQDRPGLEYSVFGDEATSIYYGFVAERSVMAIGTLERGAEGLELQAEFVYGGTRAEYINRERNNVRFAWIFGAIFGGVGAIFVVIGVFWLLNMRRRSMIVRV